MQDLVLSVYHAARIAFQLAAAHKLFENSNGRALVRVVLSPQGQVDQTGFNEVNL